jgi:hypothetical protein
MKKFLQSLATEPFLQRRLLAIEQMYHLIYKRATPQKQQKKNGLEKE